MSRPRALLPRPQVRERRTRMGREGSTAQNSEPRRGSAYRSTRPAIGAESWCCAAKEATEGKKGEAEGGAVGEVEKEVVVEKAAAVVAGGEDASPTK